MSASSPSSWQASVSDLISIISRNEDDDNVKTTGNIEKACVAILESDDAGVSVNSATDLPEAVRSTVTTIYLRTLIKLGKYNAVVEYCQHKLQKPTSLSESESGPPAINEEEGNNNYAEEVAYCLYRLKHYDACSQICSATSTTGNFSRGIMHIHAQALYRMGETIHADAVYRQLLSTTATSGEDNQSSSTKAATIMDADEREDTLSNALANCIANYTPGSNLLLSLSNTKSWLENEDILSHLLTTYGTESPTTASSTSTNADDLLQNYDLAYNLGTYLLVSSEVRSQSQLLQAKNLLEHAEISASTILDSSSPTTAEEGKEEHAAERAEKAQLQQQQLIEREANPIRANLALSKLLLGGTTNEEALRSYLTLVTKCIANKSKGATKSVASVEGNLLAVASNNLAVLRDGKESVFDVLKRIPVTSSLSVSEDVQDDSITKRGGREKASGTMVPLVGATPQQVRTALYNRALLFAKMGNVRDCLEALNLLRASLLISYHGDESEQNKLMNEEGLSKMGTAPKRTKGKRTKKDNTVVFIASSGEIDEKDVPTAKPATNDEASSWYALTNLLESELYRKSESKTVSPNNFLDDAIAKLEIISSSNDNFKNNDDGDASPCVLLYTMSQIMLHRAIVNNSTHPSKEATQPLIEVLESLPTTMKSCPGVAITLALQYASSSDNQKNDIVERILLSLGNDALARLAMAEFHIARRQYADAAKLLQVIVDEDGENGSVNAPLPLEAMALLVKALSFTDPDKAEIYSASLKEAIEERAGGKNECGSQVNGEILESMDIPRFVKKSTDSSARGVDDRGVGSSSKARKMIAATGGKGRSMMG